MLRSVLCVIAGMAISFILVQILFLIIMTLAPEAFPDPEAFPPEVWVGYTILGCNAIIAVISGYLTALIAKREPFKHGLALAGLTLLLGVTSSVVNSDVYPLWFGITQPTLAVIAILIGAKIREKQVMPSTVG